jgi:phosphoglycolate phosphatase-like HAD superfamily hydrolase
MFDKGKKVLMFDWDGTLFDSMPIKYKVFGDVVAAYLSSRNHNIIPPHVRDIYKQNSSEPLVDAFNKVAKHYGMMLSKQDIDNMSGLLAKRNETALLEAELFPDATMLLTALKATPYKIYISSSVSKEELYPLVKRNIPAHILARISDIFGNEAGFSKGKGHVENILRQEQCKPEACTMFDDDEAELVLSKNAGVDCRLVDRNGSYTGSSWQKISSFKEVIACL